MEKVTRKHTTIIPKHFRQVTENEGKESIESYERLYPEWTCHQCQE